MTTETPDYYLLPDGRLVFTEAYHLKRGHCCGNGCLHCPYDFAAVPQPRREQLLARRTTQTHDSNLPPAS
ncbi:MAG: hypothetical protein EOP52_10170 [Sphingobacteriales bacterium]|nr:MAG: hypothetical protein EOP52_10170 [Sphingobacteriales bacterium]